GAGAGVRPRRGTTRLELGRRGRHRHLAPRPDLPHRSRPPRRPRGRRRPPLDRRGAGARRRRRPRRVETAVAGLRDALKPRSTRSTRRTVMRKALLLGPVVALALAACAAAPPPPEPPAEPAAPPEPLVVVGHASVLEFGPVLLAS